MKRLDGGQSAGSTPGPKEGDAIRDFLLGLLRRAVREELADLELQAPASRPSLVDRNGLARALDVSVSTVDRLRAENAPTVWIGDAPRFELEAVIAWLRSRGAQS